MSRIIDRIQEKAEELRKVRDEIAFIEAEAEKSMAALKERKEALQGELLTEFAKHGLSSIKVATGETYARAVRKGVVVTNEAIALRWATFNHAVRIDSRLASQVLKDTPEDQIPIGFKLQEIAYISVRKPKSKGEADGEKE